MRFLSRLTIVLLSLFWFFEGSLFFPSSSSCVMSFTGCVCLSFLIQFLFSLLCMCVFESVWGDRLRRISRLNVIEKKGKPASCRRVFRLYKKRDWKEWLLRRRIWFILCAWVFVGFWKKGEIKNDWMRRDSYHVSKRSVHIQFMYCMFVHTIIRSVGSYSG